MNHLTTSSINTRYLSTHHAQPAERFLRRGGFTMMEILLVMALLVIIGGVAVVGLSGTLGNQQLRYAGDEMRIAWTRARVSAMKTGRIHVFRYQPGERQYKVEQWVGENDATEGMLDSDGAAAGSDLSTTAGSNSGGGGATDSSSGGAAQTALSGSEVSSLPKGITFADGSTTETNRSMLAEEDAATTGVVTDGVWSTPVLFYPDGQTSDAFVVVRSEDERYVKVTLRGLTGASRASDILTLEEVAAQ